MQRQSLASCTTSLSGFPLPCSGQHAVLDHLRIHPSAETGGGHSPAWFSVEALPSASKAKGAGSVTARGHPCLARTAGTAVIHISSWQTCLPAGWHSAWQLWDVTEQGVGWDHTCPSPSPTPSSSPQISFWSHMCWLGRPLLIHLPKALGTAGVASSAKLANWDQQN